jgi:hypothetical protein
MQKGKWQIDFSSFFATTYTVFSINMTINFFIPLYITATTMFYSLSTMCIL